MIYILMLNDMRAPNIETLATVAWSDDAEALKDLVARERVTLYKDGRYSKSFRKDGPLEWYNVPTSAGGAVGEIREFPTLTVVRSVLHGPIDIPNVATLGGG